MTMARGNNVQRLRTRAARVLALSSALAMVMVPAHLRAQAAPSDVIVPSEADRLELPMAGPKPPVITTLDAANVAKLPRFEVRAPQGAPNVVVIMLDDMGFAQSSAFGGPIAMPNVAKAAEQGLRYNRFHTSAICSATRAALLTGRNPHQVNIASVVDISTSFPGNTGVIPLQTAPLPGILRDNGYATAMFGKAHEAPSWERSPIGPYRQWPTGLGFEKFYGILGGETDMYVPEIYDGTAIVARPKKLDYHFTTDMTDKAIEWAKTVHSLTPDKPFFLYYAPGATHAPHHVPKEWTEKYKGRFSKGWDKLREEVYARQLKMGIIPPGTKLTPRPPQIPAWDSMSADQKKFLERQMETYAGFADHTDAEIGRLLDSLKAMGVMDNTLVFLILGDNGASAEGGPLGTDNERRALNGPIATTEQVLGKIDEWGGPKTHPHYAVGWAWAGNTPFQWTKQIASHFGGTRNGMIVNWPGRIADQGVLRNQFHHVIDIAPTVLEAAGIPQPAKVNGVAQDPVEGVSMAYTFKDARAKDRRTTQYFEIAGNRAIYDKGWVAASRLFIPWVREPSPPLDKAPWELYNVDKDFSQADNLAAKMPDKLKEMQALFESEAIRNHVYPIDIRRAERMDPVLAGRPDLPNGRKSMTLVPGMRRLHESSIVGTLNARYRISTEVELTGNDGEGVIIAHGGRFTGWSLFMKDNQVRHEYNIYGDERFKLASPALAPGKHTIVYEFTPDSAARGAGGVATLTIDGKEVQRIHMSRTVPFAMFADDGIDVGMDGGSAVSDDYSETDNAFKGKLGDVRVELP